MTDLEISKALALAIGWKRVMPEDILGTGVLQCWVYTGAMWREFDYRDPAVIWEIAKRYSFPYLAMRGGWCANKGISVYFADTPEKAVALAVIGSTQ